MDGFSALYQEWTCVSPPILQFHCLSEHETLSIHIYTPRAMLLEPRLFSFSLSSTCLHNTLSRERRDCTMQCKAVKAPLGRGQDSCGFVAIDKTHRLKLYRRPSSAAAAGSERSSQATTQRHSILPAIHSPLPTRKMLDCLQLPVAQQVRPLSLAGLSTSQAAPKSHSRPFHSSHLPALLSASRFRFS